MKVSRHPGQRKDRVRRPGGDFRWQIIHIADVSGLPNRQVGDGYADAGTDRGHGRLAAPEGSAWGLGTMSQMQP